MNVQRDRIAAFLRLATEEAGAARLLARPAPRQAAYLCQQCAEKLARAILTAAGVAFGPGHNLGQMAAALPPDHAWRSKLQGLDKHSPAATRFRYPSPSGRLPDPPDPGQIERDLAELAELLAAAREDLRAFLQP